jgi:hypothetical protein
MFEVPGDRLRPVIKTLASQLPTQRDNPLRHRRGSTPRIGMRPPGPRLQALKAIVAVSGEPSVEVLT